MRESNSIFSTRPSEHASSEIAQPWLSLIFSPLMEKCVIAFIHYVRKNQIPDPDNLDVKAVIDALKGKMIVEDDVLRVSLYHEGILSESLLTEVYILEKSELCGAHFPVAVFGMI